MEKLGVVTEEPSKEASEEKKGICPRCGAKLLPRDASNAPRCPKCGTEPFEPR